MSNGLIQATSQGIAGTYKDGTIKVVITIEPTDASEAFSILGTPGAPLVIGQLTQEAAQAALQQSAVKGAQAPVKHEQEAVKQEEMKGGELAKWAGILSGDEQFWDWAGQNHLRLWTECEKHALEATRGNYEPDVEAAAAVFIRRYCGVTSRRELDHNKQAGLAFREEIMKPFHQWREEQ